MGEVVKLGLPDDQPLWFIYRGITTEHTADRYRRANGKYPFHWELRELGLVVFLQASVLTAQHCVGLPVTEYTWPRNEEDGVYFAVAFLVRGNGDVAVIFLVDPILSSWDQVYRGTFRVIGYYSLRILKCLGEKANKNISLRLIFSHLSLEGHWVH